MSDAQYPPDPVVDAAEDESSVDRFELTRQFEQDADTLAGNQVDAFQANDDVPDAAVNDVQTTLFESLCCEGVEVPDRFDDHLSGSARRLHRTEYRRSAQRPSDDV